jgi:hypothetical protein
MDIHKPKPWHGLREFLKEYVIIVVGVLTALGAEQAVEWLHWRHQVEETRATLNEEVTYDLKGLIRRQQVAPCFAHRLADLRVYLLARSQSDPGPPPAPVGRPRIVAMRVNAWESAKTTQVLAHMPIEERERYTRVYDGFELLENFSRRDFEGMADLGLVDDAALLDPPAWSQIKAARMREFWNDRAVNSLLPDLIKRAETIVPTPAVDPSDPDWKLQEFCRPWYPAAAR